MTDGSVEAHDVLRIAGDGVTHTTFNLSGAVFILLVPPRGPGFDFSQCFRDPVVHLLRFTGAPLAFCTGVGTIGADVPSPRQV